MLNKLDERHPLGGPSWFNWSKLMFGVLTPILLAMFWGGSAIMQKHLTVWTEIPVMVEANTRIIQEMNPKLDAILKIQYTMTGNARIGERPAIQRPAYREGVWINELSSAIIYRDAGRIRVTFVRDGRRTEDLRILGTVSIPKSDVLIEVTYMIVSALRLDENTREIPVILEPCIDTESTESTER
jgi:hypothetical protein